MNYIKYIPVLEVFILEPPPQKKVSMQPFITTVRKSLMPWWPQYLSTRKVITTKLVLFVEDMTFFWGGGGVISVALVRYEHVAVVTRGVGRGEDTVLVRFQKVNLSSHPRPSLSHHSFFRGNKVSAAVIHSLSCDSLRPAIPCDLWPSALVFMSPPQWLLD